MTTDELRAEITDLTTRANALVRRSENGGIYNQMIADASLATALYAKAQLRQLQLAAAEAEATRPRGLLA